MPLNPLFQFSTLPTTSAAAIREFNDRYLAVLAASKPTGWADQFGDLVPTDRPKITFPVSQMRTRYLRTEGQPRFHGLREASFDIQSEEFDGGYEALLKDLFLNVFAYRNWQQAPGRLVLAEEQFRHNQIALIMDGTGTRGGSVGAANDPGATSRTCVDGTNFFGTTHPINITNPGVLRATDSATTWSNYQSSAKNILGSVATGTSGTYLLDNLQGEVISMMNQVPDENGVLMGVQPDTILVPYDYYEPTKNMLANARVMNFVADAGGATNAIGAAAVDQIYKGRFNVVGVKEFTQTTGATADWYLVDSTLLREGLMPWIAMRQTMPESLSFRWWDESSDFFKDTGRIKMSSHIWYGFSVGLPHAIRRVKGPTR